MFYRQQSVVFRDAFGTAEGAGLDLASACSNRKVRNESVLGFARPMRSHRAVAGLLCHRHSLQSLGHRADLIQLDQNGVSDSVANARREDFRIGDEVVIADEL